MPGLKKNCLYRFRSNRGDYLSVDLKSGHAAARPNTPSWPEGFRDLWYVMGSASLEPGLFQISSISWKCLSVPAKGNNAQFTLEYEDNREWESLQKSGGVSEFRNTYRGEPLYLHRSPHGDSVTYSGNERDAGNNWVIEDMGLRPEKNFEPLKGALVPGQLVRLNCFTGPSLVRNVDGRVRVLPVFEVFNYWPGSLISFWKVCNGTTGALAFQSITGEYLAMPDKGSPGYAPILVPKIDDGSSWDVLRRNDGKFELRNRAQYDHYLHYNEKLSFYHVPGVSGSRWDIELYVPKGEVKTVKGENGKPDKIAQYNDWMEVLKARPEMWP